MGDPHHRQCLNRLLTLSGQADALADHEVASEVDRMLACNGRRACVSHLACACLASEMASRLARRFR
ncbi:MAG: hypothetical protein NVV74_24755 [Magnetospirillum sp.]|nr:hypothetical protein [Magnetospirillum sp.]